MSVYSSICVSRTYQSFYHGCLQHIEYLKHQVSTRVDAAIQPATVVVQTGSQALANARNAADIGYGLLQVCALNPQCCRLPARCFPTQQDNAFKNLNLKSGVRTW